MSIAEHIYEVAKPLPESLALEALLNIFKRINTLVFKYSTSS